MAGDIPIVSGDDAQAGCRIESGAGTAKHLSIWNKTAEEKTFSMSQTIRNMAAGSYTAKIESVGNANTKHNLILKAHNDTTNKEVTVNVDTDQWDVYVSSATKA